MKKKWILAIIGIFVLIIILSLRQIIDLDIGFHLRGGEWMLKNHSFHHYDVFTYTVNQNEYIAMYWLYQIILYLVFTIGGYCGINIMNTLLIITVFLIIFLRMKSARIPLWLISVILFWAVSATEIRFSVRPEIVTWIFLALFLFILDQYVEHKKNFLFLLPVIQILWVNFHGLFILGWVTMGCYFIGEWFRRRSPDKRLLKWSLIATAVSIINPYLFKGIAFPFYLFTRLQSTSIFKDVISELASPWSGRAVTHMASLPLYTYYVISVVTFILFIITYKKRRIYDYLLVALFFYISFTAVRNIPLFIIVAVQIIGLSIKELFSGFQYKRYHLAVFFDRNGPYIFLVIIVLFSLRVITNAFYIEQGGGNFGLGLDRFVHPLGAAEFITRNRLQGRILNDMNHGSWLIWGVRQPVFIDGRLEVMKERFFKEYHLSHTKGGLKKLVKKYRPDMIIYDYSYPEALAWDIDLMTMTDWRPIYWDHRSVIYARKDFAVEIPTLDFLQNIAQMKIDTTIDKKRAWDILRLPSKGKSLLWLEGFYREQYFPYDLMQMAFYAYMNLKFRAAEILYLEVLRRSRYHLKNVYYNLGAVYYFGGKYKKALYCYQRVLEEEPDNKKARARIFELRNKVK
ncbi:hypothetical protein BXT86_01455 [candidate division WOR-3 bacterium 4484_100]|uniref:Uncharacterized protein n=1 Tax=candidate division WOR-3 bacterium 4484_100 TaxID=1936077 RepID=A0A1V4QHP7_UNCW3|nr:MAG: hypothetical protein BXT86_01455 [candidate division WOR-3 bacterium 4484_100]